MKTAIDAEGRMMNRWWRVAGALAMNLPLGALYAWSIFVLPLEKEFGWSRTETSWVFTIAVFVFGLSFILAGRLQDRKGPFWISVAGGLLYSLGWILAAFTSNLAFLFVTMGAILGVGSGFGYATPIPVLSKWFPDRRGLAVGLAVAGYGGGSFIIAPLAQYMIPALGWRETFLYLGVGFFVSTMIGAAILRNPPEGYRPAGWEPAPATAKVAATRYEFRPGEMVRTPTFYLMWIAFALGTGAGLMLISQLVPFGRQQLGIGATAAALAISVGALGNASGRIFSGWLSDAIGRLQTLRLMVGVSILAFLILPRISGVAQLYALVFAVYYCYGTQLSLYASTTGDFFGTKNLGVNYGLVFSAWGVAGIIGPIIAGRLFDVFGNYTNAFYVGSAICAVALCSLAAARRPVAPGAAIEEERLRRAA
ncbi:MAG: L-lactate MFS transporter [Candidatus Deferrimicrobiaceae bacterium]